MTLYHQSLVKVDPGSSTVGIKRARRQQGRGGSVHRIGGWCCSLPENRAQSFRSRPACSHLRSWACLCWRPRPQGRSLSFTNTNEQGAEQ